jgi:hypothetical protein
MKYVMFDTGEFVIIPDSQCHKDVILPGRTPISAGFLTMKHCEGKFVFEAYGGSESMCLRASEKDARVIQVFIAMSNKIGETVG